MSDIFYVYRYMKYAIAFLLACCLMAPACRKSPASVLPPSDTKYFPPLIGSAWETKAPSDLGWNTQELPALMAFLREKGTRAFMILVNGRIVVEEYMNGHGPADTWAWNSAGKTLVTATVGIARHEGLLNIEAKASQYLGAGWTSAPPDKEQLITLRHLLSMSSGLNAASQLVTTSNLTYVADAGTRWAYANVFQKLMDVVTVSTGRDFRDYFNDKLRNRIGMEGQWNFGPVFKIYHSNARSMARFGLLALHKGNWAGQQVVQEDYFNESTRTSQPMNPSYGYMWWLNGKESFIPPGTQTVRTGPLIPEAPADTYAALGADDQKIYVVPSRQMVIVRMGEAAEAQSSFAMSGFDNTLWLKLKAVIR